MRKYEAQVMKQERLLGIRLGVEWHDQAAAVDSRERYVQHLNAGQFFQYGSRCQPGGMQPQPMPQRHRQTAGRGAFDAKTSVCQLCSGVHDQVIFDSFFPAVEHPVDTGIQALLEQTAIGRYGRSTQQETAPAQNSRALSPESVRNSIALVSITCA